MRRSVRPTLAILILSASIHGCGRAPSIGPDKEAFTTIDALFTAVSMRELAQLERNAATLDVLHHSGKLPDDAHDVLAAIIARARAGAWEPASDELRAFMLDQGG